MTRKRLLLSAVLALLLGALSWAVIYYTGDQEGQWAESDSFTIDTSDPESVTRPFSLSTSSTSSNFTIDTREEDSVTKTFTLLSTGESDAFTIDTRDPDSQVYVISLAVAETSSTFTIDTREEGSTYRISDAFAIDTRDPDHIVFARSLSLAEWTEGFTVDTRQPMPEDSDGNGLHDLWELIFLGSVGTFRWDEDLDGDGLALLMEFAMGMDPLKPNTPRAIEFWMDSTGESPTLVIRYWRHILAARMVEFEIRTSEDLLGWASTPGSWTEVAEVIHDNGYIERITMERPWEGEPPSRLFVSLRLRALPLDL